MKGSSAPSGVEEDPQVFKGYDLLSKSMKGTDLLIKPVEIDKVTLSTVTEQHHFNFTIKCAKKKALFFIKK